MPADGHAIQTRWTTRRATLIRKWRGKSARPTPDNVAGQPPLAPPPPPPPAPAAPILAIAPVITVVNVPPVTVLAVPVPTSQPTVPSATEQQGDGEISHPATPSPPGSPDTLAPGSPLYVLVNDPTNGHFLSPTRGERAQVKSDMNSQDWKFVRVLYQTGLDEDGWKIRALRPRMSVHLYVRPDAARLIQDVGTLISRYLADADRPAARCRQV
jgi:hypothetical protein